MTFGINQSSMSWYRPNGRHPKVLKRTCYKLLFFSYTLPDNNFLSIPRSGFKSAKVSDCGNSLNFYNWTEQKLQQTLDLGVDGKTPLEIRFLHDPDQCEGYVGCALFSNLFHFKRNDENGEFVATKVLDIPSKKVEGWFMDEMNGLMGDILLSLDDRFLYLNNWIQGDIRQYDISVRDSPRLVGQIFLGGAAVRDRGVTVIEDKELSEQPEGLVVRGKRLEGGPQMLQLSLDGRRLYVSSCLYSAWDKEVYPESINSGGYIVQIDVDIDNGGGLKLNDNFLVHFGDEPYGPTLPHEIRYPGGDCTSDIWLSTKSSNE